MPATGWYPDPAQPDWLRYWDGARWTVEVQPRSVVDHSSGPWGAPAELDLTWDAGRWVLGPAEPRPPIQAAGVAAEHGAAASSVAVAAPPAPLPPPPPPRVQQAPTTRRSARSRQGFLLALLLVLLLVCNLIAFGQDGPAFVVALVALAIGFFVQCREWLATRRTPTPST